MLCARDFHHSTTYLHMALAIHCLSPLIRLSQQLQKHFAAHREVLKTLQGKPLDAVTSEQVMPMMITIYSLYQHVLGYLSLIRQTFEGIGEAEGLEVAQRGMQKLHGLVRKLATEIRDVAPEMIYGQARAVLA